MAFQKMTPEQMAENRALAQAANAARRASAGDLKQDWMDAEAWADMARDKGIRLPAKDLRPDPHLMRRYMRKLDMKEREFMEWGGYAKLDDFARLNPRTPLWALIGFLLEYVLERDANRAALKARLQPSA